VPLAVGFELIFPQVGALSAVLQVLSTKAAALQLKSGLPFDQCWLKT